MTYVLDEYLNYCNINIVEMMKLTKKKNIIIDHCRIELKIDVRDLSEKLWIYSNLRGHPFIKEDWTSIF